MPVKSSRKPERQRTPARVAYGQRRGDLLAAGRECFAQHGIEGTSVDAILEHCGASVGSLYQHFASKDGLAAALYLNGIESYFFRARSLFDAATTTENKVKALVRSYIDCVEADPMIATYLIQARAYLSKTRHAKEIARKNEEFLPAIRNWFRERIEQRELRPLPPECIVALVEGPARHFARRWLDGRASRPISEVREILAQAAWDALRLQPKSRASRLRRSAR